MNELEETREILRLAIEASDAHIRRMQELLIKSEERIDKTNTMISQLVCVVAELKGTFEHLIDQAIKSRDHAMDQSSQLMHKIASVEADLKLERQKHEALLHQLVEHLAKAHGSGTSVNIKQ